MRSGTLRRLWARTPRVVSVSGMTKSMEVELASGPVTGVRYRWKVGWRRSHRRTEASRPSCSVTRRRWASSPGSNRVLDPTEEEQEVPCSVGRPVGRQDRPIEDAHRGKRVPRGTAVGLRRGDRSGGGRWINLLRLARLDLGRSCDQHHRPISGGDVDPSDVPDRQRIRCRARRGVGPSRCRLRTVGPPDPNNRRLAHLHRLREFAARESSVRGITGSGGRQDSADQRRRDPGLSARPWGVREDPWGPMHDEPPPPQGNGPCVDQEFASDSLVPGTLGGPKHDPSSDGYLRRNGWICASLLDLQPFGRCQGHSRGDSHRSSPKCSRI